MFSNLRSAPLPKENALCLVLGKPLGPGDYPEVQLRILLEHRDILKLMAIRVAEVEGSSRHPTDHAQLCRFRTEKRERCNTLRFQPLRCVQQVVYSHLECHVQRES